MRAPTFILLLGSPSCFAEPMKPNLLLLLSLGFALGMPGISIGCLWDRDTLATEANAHPDLVRVITGRFERNPPRFYEMRLERVVREIADSPKDLGLYDDATVACDRLHRGDEAESWLVKKKVVLDALPESPEKGDHLYRYHANLGRSSPIAGFDPERGRRR